jgi:hypothetical protein
MLRNVERTWGIVLIVASSMVIASSPFLVRNRWSDGVFNAVLAVGGAGIGVGALLVQSDVGMASWVLTPIVLAIFAVAHVRALFAAGGPFRT